MVDLIVIDGDVVSMLAAYRIGVSEDSAAPRVADFIADNPDVVAALALNRATSNILSVKRQMVDFDVPYWVLNLKDSTSAGCRGDRHHSVITLVFDPARGCTRIGKQKRRVHVVGPRA